MVGLIVIVIVVVLPHLVVYRYGTILGDTFDKVFTGAVLGARDVKGSAAGPVPGDGERVNVLLVGVDKRGKRTENLTDTMMVASLDPVGHTVSIVSIPRDLIGTPLGDGDVYGAEAEFADVLRRPPPEGVPAGRHAHARGCGRGAPRHPDPLLRDGSTSPASSRWSTRSAAWT